MDYNQISSPEEDVLYDYYKRMMTHIASEGYVAVKWDYAEKEGNPDHLRVMWKSGVTVTYLVDLQNDAIEEAELILNDQGRPIEDNLLEMRRFAKKQAKNQRRSKPKSRTRYFKKKAPRKKRRTKNSK